LSRSGKEGESSKEHGWGNVGAHQDGSVLRFSKKRKKAGIRGSKKGVEKLGGEIDKETRS